jgi:hypothetical protein
MREKSLRDLFSVDNGTHALKVNADLAPARYGIESTLVRVRDVEAKPTPT